MTKLNKQYWHLMWPLTLASTCYFAIPDRNWREAPPRLVCPLIAIELRKKTRTKSSGCFESNHSWFHYLRSHFDLPSAGQTKNAPFGMINVFANNYNFWTKKVRGNRKSPSHSFHRDTSKHMHPDPERSIWKFDLRLDQMTWTDEWPR